MDFKRGNSSLEAVVVGLIQNILFDFIESTAGPRAVEEVKSRAGVPRGKEFSLDEAHDDGEWQRLLAATCAVLNISQAKVEEDYADFFLRDALKRWPLWFKMAGSAREFLEQQPKILESFARGVPDLDRQLEISRKIKVEQFDDELVVHYRSPNRLCGLYVALAKWAIRHYGDKASMEELRCLKKGDPECEIHIHWES